ncbi:MAG: hypothetical protein FWC16_08420 [Defluviitaleaceae bacterium]|nr:hypothetical protein [Defluviitaleaceae bacterium]MCL2274934.1 hypothetical protein [Defluviitaleaceae bacterium]
MDNNQIKKLLLKLGVLSIGVFSQFASGDSLQAIEIAKSVIKDVGDISKLEQKIDEAKRSGKKEFKNGKYTIILK